MKKWHWGKKVLDINSLLKGIECHVSRSDSLNQEASCLPKAKIKYIASWMNKLITPFVMVHLGPFVMVHLGTTLS